MSFDNVRLPLDIERGVKVAPQFAVSKVRLANGFSRSLLRQNFPAREWNISYGLQNLTGAASNEGLLAIYNFYLARGGTLNSFRMRDWLDYQIVQEVIGTGDNIEYQYQIIKTYTDFGSFIRAQDITKPSNDAGDTVTTVRVNAVAQTETTDFDIDYTSGIMTFLAAGSNVPVADATMSSTGTLTRRIVHTSGTVLAVNDYVKVSGFVNSKNAVLTEEAWQVITTASGQIDFTLNVSSGLARDLTLGVAEGPVVSGVNLNRMTPVVDTHDIDTTVDFDRHVSFDRTVNFELALETVGRVKKIMVIEER